MNNKNIGIGQKKPYWSRST